jgi:general secretion pathway protein G
VEILIVIAIILILTSTVGFVGYRYLDRARQVTVRSQIETFALALQGYALDCTRYPTQEQGLEALWTKPILEPVPSGWAGPYLDKRIPNDPWGNGYEYTVPGPNGLPYGVRCLGSDGREGGEGNEKDVSSWEG